MRTTTYPNKAQFDRRFKEALADPATVVDVLDNPRTGVAEVVAVWDRKGDLIELFRWVDLT